MAYNKTLWKDRIVEKPNTYRKVENSDGTITLYPVTGQVIEKGTPVSAANLNKIENGIVEVYKELDTKIDGVANKGTTVEVIERVTKQEIDRQIADGTMANLTIAKGSITQDKLDPNIKFGIEDGEVTNVKIADGAITKNKLDPNIKFGILDLDDDIVAKTVTCTDEVQLFDKNKGEGGYVNAANGQIIRTNKDWTSDYIPCTPGETIRKDNNSSNAVNAQDVVFFTKDKQYISGIILKPTDIWKTFTIPANAYFFRFDMLTTYKDTEKIYAQRGGWSIEECRLSDEIKVKGENLIGLEVGVNQLGGDVITKTVIHTDEVQLFDKNKGESGYLNTTNGEVFTSSKDWTSDYIPCTPGETIRKEDNSSNAVNNQDVGFFTKDKQYISGIILKPTDDWKTFKIPDNAYFFRFDMLIQYKDTEKIYAKRDEGIPTYQLSDGIKIKKSNIIGMEEDESTKEQISLYNEDGVKFLLTIDSEGELDIRPAKPNLPSNFNAFTTRGKSCARGDILVAPHTEDANLGWLIVLDSNLNLKKYKQLTSFAYNFRKYRNKAGDIRYIYCQSVNKEFPKMTNNGGYDNVKLVVTDKNFNILREHRLKAHGTVQDNHPGENHEVIYFDDDHYLLTAYVKGVVSNIPGKSGQYKAVNCVIQEVKDGEVVFHWESIDHTELYEYACRNKDFTNYPNSQGTYNDYHHLNSVQVDPLNPNHLLVSSRFIGLMKIDKTTGNIIWMFGRGGRIDFKGMTQAQAPFLQHHMTRVSDGSIICFDNEGCATNNTRICRYWLDETTMTMTRFKEYKTNHPRSQFMGGVDMIREGVFLINYGGKYQGLTFEEYDFNENKQNFSFRFNDGTDCYRVFKEGY